MGNLQTVKDFCTYHSKASLRQAVKIPIQDKVGEFLTFDFLSDPKEHFAIRFEGQKQGINLTKNTTLVRIHSECLTGDIFSSRRCDCGSQLQEALALLSQEGGVLLYLRQEGRGIGLYNKLDAYAEQLKGLDTFDANRVLGLPEDARCYRVAAEMLQALSIHEVELLTNNPDKKTQLEFFGISVSKIRNTGLFVTHDNLSYLQAKKLRTAHSFEL